MSADDANIIGQARNLWQATRTPRGDAAWPHLRPHLLAVEARLQCQLRDDPDDDAAAALLQEVRQRFLGRQD